MYLPEKHAGTGRTTRRASEDGVTSLRKVVTSALDLQARQGTVGAVEFLRCRGVNDEVVCRVLLPGLLPGLNRP